MRRPFLTLFTCVHLPLFEFHEIPQARLTILTLPFSRDCELNMFMGNSVMHALFDEMKDYLEASQLMVVASSQNGKPYVATVFFCFDENMNLYFLSTLGRRHSQEILNNSNVAAAIASHVVQWGGVMKGLQIEGTCTMLKEVEAKQAVELYIKRFPNASKIIEKFETEGGHKVWKITPTRVKIWDESKYDYEGKVFNL